MQNLILIVLISFITIIGVFILYKKYKKIEKKDKKKDKKDKKIEKEDLNGNYQIVCKNDNQPLLPYMFNQLSSKFIKNDNCNWNITPQTNNLYKIHLRKDPICAYIHNEKVCLYELSKNIKRDDDSDNEDCDKPTLCSTDNINEPIPQYNENQSQFIITKIQDKYYTFQQNGKFICKKDGMVKIQNQIDDSCIWILNKN